MHPAPSIILFTALSGLGFGLMFFLGFGLPEPRGWSAFFYFLVAYALGVGGLLASTLHLGNPQRAVKAFRQWRTSWLSREGVLAVLTLLVMAVYAIGLIFLDRAWPPIGWLGAALALLTVFTTSKIYHQMKTVPRWRQPLTPVLFLAYALAGGALLSGRELAAPVLLLILATLQWAAWLIGDGAFARDGHTIETATGLGGFGKVRMLESPHSGSSYLLREMVHVVARRHARKLRLIAIVTLGLLPAAILFLPLGPLALPLAIASHLVGLLTSRWLFFAEAEHVVGLYYDRR